MSSSEYVSASNARLRRLNGSMYLFCDVNAGGVCMSTDQHLPRLKVMTDNEITAHNEVLKDLKSYNAINEYLHRVFAAAAGR